MSYISMQINYIFFFFLAKPYDWQDLSSLIRDWTQAMAVKVPNASH